MTQTAERVARQPSVGRRATPRSTLTNSSGLALGVAVTWFSILVLIPLAAVVVAATTGGWGGFWSTLTNSQTLAAITLDYEPTVESAAAVGIRTRAWRARRFIARSSNNE